MKGYVYLFRLNETNYVKIGMTEQDSVMSRFIGMQTYAPKGAEIICVIPTNEPRKLEQKLHKDFAAYRMNGEFFELDHLKIERIKSKYVEQTMRDAQSKAIALVAELGSDEGIKRLNSFFTTQIKVEKVKDISEEVYEFVNQKFKGQAVPPTKVYHSLPDTITKKISLNLFGKIMRMRYAKRNIKIAGSSTPCYIIE